MADTPFGGRSKGSTRGGTATKTRPAADPTDADEEPEVKEAGGFDPGTANDGEDPFAAPPAPSGLKINELVGELLLIKPLEVRTIATTVSPESEAVECDVVRLEMPEDAEEDEEDYNPGVLVFQQALRKALGRILASNKPYLLGRLGKGTKQPGKNAPYIFLAPEESDMVKARAWIKANPGVL